MSRKSVKRRAQPKKPPTFKESWTAWYESKRPLLGYALRFAVVMAGFYLISLTPIYQQAVSGCTGFDYSWFLAAAIAAFPATIIRRGIGIVAGVVILLLLNSVRVSSLYWVGVYHPEHFALVHEQLWAVVLNIATICLMVAWIVWIKRRHET